VGGRGGDREVRYVAFFFHSWCDLHAEVGHLGSAHTLQCLCPRIPGASQHGIAQEDGMVRGENEERGAPARDLEVMAELRATQ
jgi:hypothetical protein